MANKMLIDAAHPEETRVVVLRGNRVEDFDFESASKKPLRGNIYLAKVTRVEPSLQAAFIEYGGNRHGFLAFSEIHPDYYQIPVADRQALLEEEARAHREEEDEQRQASPRRSRRRRHGRDGGRSREADGDGALSAADAGGPVEVEAENGDEGDGTVQEGTDVEIDAILTPEAAHDVAAEVLAVPDSAEPTAFTIEEAGPAQAGDDASHPAPEGEVSAEPSDPEPANPEDAARSPAMPAAAYEEPGDRIAEEITALEPGAPADAGALEDDAAPDFRPEPADDDVEAAPDEPSENGDRHADSAHDENGSHEEEPVEQLGGDALEDVPYRTPRLRRHYKIQEVIKRRQILLVQVVKEERGNKGAALTTYLSLAGRYSVLMPNTARGGGISRKITDAEDRKRLKAIAGELEVPEGMGIILRTAGAARGEGEVKRDFEYLLRMWETVRELTLRSTAPTLVYEEGSLIKRAIRDLYSKEIDEIVVAGDGGYQEAKDFMRLLMPGQGRAISPYRDSQPIFAKWGAETQLDAMFSNHVTLRSGGYLVINQTEALVAIDVNSGRSTREHNIEDTALRTNLEAADEVARQLRLRDLAGLIVVDFIDMEEGRNNRAVERRMKDALKNDRARIQIGRISHFGLLEMSRQRIRTGIMEGSTVLCPHCAGAGTVRSTSSIALHVLRVLEDHLIRSNSFNLIVRTRMEVALYILNQKRAHLTDLEGRFGVTVTVMADATLTGTVYHAIERGEAATPAAVPQARTPALGYQDAASEDAEFEAEPEADEDEALAAESTAEDGAPALDDDEEAGGERRRRRRRRRRGRDRDRGPSTIEADADQPSDVGMETMARAAGDLPDGGPENDADVQSSSNGTEIPFDDVVEPAGEPTPVDQEGRAAVPAMEAVEAVEPVAAEGTLNDDAPPRRRRSRRASSRTAAPEGEQVEAGEADEAPTAARRSRRARSRAAAEEAPSLALDPPVDIPASDVVSGAPPSADVDIGADTVKNFPPEADTAATPAEAASPTPEVTSGTAEAAPAADGAVTMTEAAALPEPEPEQPPRPKRSGWWQRAKATITGE